LRRQLAVSLGTFKQFTVESVQMAAERDRRIEAELGGVLATLATRMDDTTRQGMEAIRTMQEAAAGALVDTTTARVEASLARSMDQMGQAFAALAQAAETLSRRDHDASAALLARFDAVGQSLDGMAGQVATLSRRFEEVGDSVDTSRIGAAASAMSSALSDGAVSIREATVTLQTSAEASAASIDQASRALVDQMEARRRGFRLFGNAKG
jgi:ABC-type transporter Mla subunit MlaD